MSIRRHVRGWNRFTTIEQLDRLGDVFSPFECDGERDHGVYRAVVAWSVQPPAALCLMAEAAED